MCMSMTMSYKSQITHMKWNTHTLRSAFIINSSNRYLLTGLAIWSSWTTCAVNMCVLVCLFIFICAWAYICMFGRSKNSASTISEFFILGGGFRTLQEDFAEGGGEVIIAHWYTYTKGWANSRPLDFLFVLCGECRFMPGPKPFLMEIIFKMPPSNSSSARPGLKLIIRN